ncbi:zinc-dependent peptidase [Thiocapsa sp.]|uniref:M90 family metallopeptidase n=1 Tax=Thiocapsa sp. TaxID=2024551 RepID=UPI00359453EF
MRGLMRWWQSRVLERERARVDPQDLAHVLDALPLLDELNEEETRRLADLALLFLRDKRLDPAQGLELTDAMRLAIALQACLPVLELGLDWYSGWYAVIVYPEEFVPEREVMGDDGVVWTEHEAKSGEAWEQGPVILSWADVEAGMERDGYNVVIHELAHKLDMRDGAANGCPPLHAGMSPKVWAETFSAAYDDLCRRVDADEETPIDPYATESPAEFFAVLSEGFFELPDLVHSEYPAVYEQMRLFYRQDPLARLAAVADEARPAP